MHSIGGRPKPLVRSRSEILWSARNSSKPRARFLQFTVHQQRMTIRCWCTVKCIYRKSADKVKQKCRFSSAGERFCLSLRRPESKSRRNADIDRFNEFKQQLSKQLLIKNGFWGPLGQHECSTTSFWLYSKVKTHTGRAQNEYQGVRVHDCATRLDNGSIVRSQNSDFCTEMLAEPIGRQDGEFVWFTHLEPNVFD